MANFDIRLDVTCDASGDGTDTAGSAVAGWLAAIEFFDGTLADAHTAVLSVTATPSAVDHNVWSTTAGDTNSDVYVQPKVQAVDASNDAISGIYDFPYISGKPKLTIASGGNGGIGGCVLHMFN